MRKTKNAIPEVILIDKEDSSELEDSEDSELARRTERDQRLTQHYLEWDMSTNRDSD